jgi:hypothetical protein
MLFPALSAATATWLLLTPYLGMETGSRAVLAVTVGAAALILSPLSLYSRVAAKTLVLLGALLALVNFVDPQGIGNLVNYATAAVGLVIAGAAPHPRSISAAALATQLAPVNRGVVRATPSDADKTPRLVVAA